MTLIRAPSASLTWWWGFGLLIAVPALILSLLGARASRAERIEREQQLREQQTQVARLADAAIAVALDKLEAALHSAEDITQSAGDQPGPALRNFFVFSIDSHGVLAFDSDKLYFGEPPLKASPPEWSLATEQFIEQAQSAEAQQRTEEAIFAYHRIIDSEPRLADWAKLCAGMVRRQNGDANARVLLAGEGWSRSKGLTPAGLPAALIACAHVERLRKEERAAFASFLEQTMGSLRSGSWWLSYETRRFYDMELRSLLKSAGSTAYQTEDSRLAEMSALERIIRQSPLTTGARRSFETKDKAGFLILRAPSGREPDAWKGIAIPQGPVQKLFDKSIAPLLAGQPFLARVTDKRGNTIWGAIAPNLPIQHVGTLQSINGLEIAFSGSNDASWVHRRQALWYGFITLLVMMVLIGLAMTGRVIRREVELGRLQNDFIAAVSHEFKSPLTSIRLLMERIRSGRLTTSTATSEYYAAIDRETKRLERLVHSLLEAQQIQAGHRHYSFARASIVEIVETAINGLRPQAEAKHIGLKAQTEDGIPELQLDTMAMTEAVENLLDNAIKYSPPSSTVTVAVRAIENQVCVDVCDQGIGIERHDLPRIFEKFYRGRRGDQQDVKGAGLGLTLVKATVEAHGGVVGATSTAGKGSRFSVRLPARIEH
jgi:signal transduction histidine kinase